MLSNENLYYCEILYSKSIKLLKNRAYHFLFPKRLAEAIQKYGEIEANDAAKIESIWGLCQAAQKTKRIEQFFFTTIEDFIQSPLFLAYTALNEVGLLQSNHAFENFKALCEKKRTDELSFTIWVMFHYGLLDEPERQAHYELALTSAHLGALGEALSLLFHYNIAIANDKKELLSLLVNHPCPSTIARVIKRLNEFRFFEKEGNYLSLIKKTSQFMPKNFDEGLQRLIYSGVFTDDLSYELIELLLIVDDASAQADRLIQLKEYHLLKPSNLLKIRTHPNSVLFLEHIKKLHEFRLWTLDKAQYYFDLLYAHSNPQELVKMLSFLVCNFVIYPKMTRDYYEVLAHKTFFTPYVNVIFAFHRLNFLHTHASFDLIKALLNQDNPARILMTYRLFSNLAPSALLEQVFIRQVFSPVSKGYFDFLLLMKKSMEIDANFAQFMLKMLIRYRDVLVEDPDITELWAKINPIYFERQDFKHIISIFEIFESKEHKSRLLNFLNQRFFQSLNVRPRRQDLKNTLLNIMNDELNMFLQDLLKPTTLLGLHFFMILIQSLQNTGLQGAWPHLENRVAFRFFESYAFYFKSFYDDEFQLFLSYAPQGEFFPPSISKALIENAPSYPMYCSKVLKKSGLFSHRLECAFFEDFCKNNQVTVFFS